MLYHITACDETNTVSYNESKYYDFSSLFVPVRGSHNSGFAILQPTNSPSRKPSPSPTTKVSESAQITSSLDLNQS